MANLYVYKGFGIADFHNIKQKPLIENEFKDRVNPIIFDEEYRQKLIIAVTSFLEDSWITYEEFSFLCDLDNGSMLIQLLNTFNKKLIIVLNNVYPEIYPLSCYLDNYDVINTIVDNSNKSIEITDEIQKKILRIYSEIININDKYFIRYKNIEYDFQRDKYEIVNYYENKLPLLNKEENPDFIFEISESEIDYISKINELENSSYKNIGIKLMATTTRNEELFNNFCAYLNKNNYYKLVLYDKYGYRNDLTDSFTDIVNRVIKVPNFNKFRDIEFYSDPKNSNELVKINQTQIMSDMVAQAENAMECEKIAIESRGKKLKGYRDIFVTAPTGSGKSLMFQIPAIYLAEKYNALTIIITPLIELMNDQVRNLHERGYLNAERLNSSINAIEKKNIVEKIDKGEINLLYLAPETLLSYPIDQLIGSRKIGMVIVDEAHIVSTWGKGFRPDYWYLGSYLDKLRRFKNYRGMLKDEQLIYCFPICTFTATAVNGGIYDDVSDIKNSLNLRDTITYIGGVVRNNIKFEINVVDDKDITNNDLYFKAKGEKLKERIEGWLGKNEKTVVYFPYASTAHAALNCSAESGFNSLSELKENFSIYTGGSTEDANQKSENMLDFRDGKKLVMFATKAFGMGIDIKYINNVYHYAASGNLNDYVQEIGRSARSKDIKEGYAITDYYSRDLNFMNTLYGMSALHNFQVRKILQIIYGVYENKRKANLIVTPDMFRPVFPNARDDSELEVKIKTALLTIEKDLTSRYKGSKTIVTKPRNMFTECFMMLDRKFEENILESEFGKYFKKIAKGRESELNKDGSYVTDMGDVFMLDLKSLWEDKYNKMTFGAFKYTLAATPNEIFKEYAPWIKPRYKVTLSMIDKSPLNTLKGKILDEINIVSEVLNEFQISGTYFTKDEFSAKLNERYKNKFKAEIVAGSYIELLLNYRDTMTASFCETREINLEKKYLISRGTFRSLAEKIINNSAFLRRFNHTPSEEMFSYEATTTKDNNGKYDAINLALLFNLINFEIIGGNRPEIFIRINYPEKVRQIAYGEVIYNNKLVEEAAERHKNDVSILNYFFRDLQGNSDRWNFIENYYLGNVYIENNKVTIKKDDNLFD